ncbi:universal stress protein [Chryseobacterium sp. SSA4.19]|uniref:universal stress protein n=1 Tax=Chryseobacterium sp. SSA4.19 TaxID=2919915 RepID=UPI001F4D8D92|nr:universal stress protein [Chryseobacterium sp. SSA4.19]MCJ8152774.1 universal stress protein [Chryseobacterium sp. SSA4.19]
MRTTFDTILVTVDFTEKSDNAVAMAVHMAGRHGARIILFHNFSNYYIIDRMGKQAIGTENAKENFNITEKGLQEIQRTIQKENSSLHVDTFIGNSSLTDSINECIISEKVDLVITGTSGRQKMKELFLGSASYEILTGIQCSVLLVPEKCHTYDFEKILVPVRVTENLQEKLAVSQNIAKKNNALISLLGICSEEDVDEIKEAYNSIWSTLSKDTIRYSTSFLLTNKKAVQISRFSKIEHADIIILNYHDENSWKSVFSENFFKQIINNTEIPLFFLKKISEVSGTPEKNAGFDITLPFPG